MSKTPRTDASFGKLKALRDSGYKGYVDEDGNKVKDINAWIKQQTSKK